MCLGRKRLRNNNKPNETIPGGKHKGRCGGNIRVVYTIDFTREL